MLRGTGRQKLGAIANAVGYYTMGFPIGISLMFAAKMGVLGTCGMSCVEQRLSTGTHVWIFLWISGGGLHAALFGAGTECVPVNPGLLTASPGAVSLKVLGLKSLGILAVTGKGRFFSSPP